MTLRPNCTDRKYAVERTIEGMYESGPIRYLKRYTALEVCRVLADYHRAFIGADQASE